MLMCVLLVYTMFVNRYLKCSIFGQTNAVDVAVQIATSTRTVTFSVC
jgi:hypothetical protein